MSIDDRIRAATEATAATVREIRPLTLPPDTTPAPSRRFGRHGHPRSRRLRRDWAGWLIPLTAAMVVVVLAIGLGALRQATRTTSAPSGSSTAAPAGQGSALAGLPRYGVVLTKVKLPHGGGVEVSDLSVIDTRTGKRVDLVAHPANITFTGVSGAADDRTFAVAAVETAPSTQPGPDAGQELHVWYLLRIAPGSSQPVKLTRLPIPALLSGANITGLALSPDGQTLAVLNWLTPATLRLYSVATGQALRTWTAATPKSAPGYGDSYGPSENVAGLTWLAGGQTLAFTYYGKGQPATVRTLDTTRPGNDLAADSRRVFTLPSSGPDACGEALLTPDGRTVLCGTQPSTSVGTWHPETLEIDAYSAATGKREGVLFRYTAEQTVDGIGALGWAGTANTVVVTVDAGTNVAFQDKVTPGLLVAGKLVPLLSGTMAARQGPGTIAF